jgi:hypothetical protein
MVAHLMPTLYFLIASAASIVTGEQFQEHGGKKELDNCRSGRE